MPSNVYAVFLAALAVHAAADAPCGCNGGQIVVLTGYNVPSAVVTVIDIATGNGSTLYSFNPPSQMGASAVAAHKNFLYIGVSPTVYGVQQAPYVFRVNLTSMEVQGSVSTPGYTCGEFAFDDELLGPDTMLCQGYQPNYYTSVLQLSFAAKSFKAMGTYPYYTISNQMHAYSPVTKTYFLRLGSTGPVSRDVMVGIDVRTGKVVSENYIQPGATAGGPLAIDPLSGVGYFVEFASANYAQLMSMDMDTGYVQPVGPLFPENGQYYQGALQATISSYDRCNMMITSLYNVVGTWPNQQVQTVYGGFDLTTGKQEFLVNMGQNGGLTVSYLNPAVAATFH